MLKDLLETKYNILKPEKQMLEHICARGTSAYLGDDDGIHGDMLVFLPLSYNINCGFLSYSSSKGVASCMQVDIKNYWQRINIKLVKGRLQLWRYATGASAEHYMLHKILLTLRLFWILVRLKC